MADVDIDARVTALRENGGGGGGNSQNGKFTSLWEQLKWY